ncbi:putative Ig domain-containing protein [Spirosoma sp. KUDC1026]|nr:putative Ig domain-containing protein [Spirosoma sp. KUDC1026]
MSGTTSVSGASTITVTATDPGSLSASTSFTLTVSPAPVVNTPPTVVNTVAPQSATVGQAYTLSLANVFTDAQTPNQLTLFANGLPAGLSLSGTTISGTPSVSGVSTVTILATDPGNLSTSTSFTLTVSPAPVVNTPPTVANAVAPQSATVGQAYALSLAGVFTDAQTPNQLTLTVSTLPAGLSFMAPATISGTPSMSGTSTITVTATDPGSLSTSASFTLTVNPVAVPPTQPFALTGVTTVSCESVSAGARRVSFVPQYTGLTGEPVSFSVVNELSPTMAAGPYSLQLYTDNPVITLVARQGAVVSQFSYNWLANCGGTTPPVNTAPTVANPIAAQSATVGQAYALSLAGVFTDAQTPNQLTLSASGLPAGLSLSGTTISGTPSVSGVSTITVTATDPGNLSSSTNFVLTVSPAGTTPPTQPFALTGVTTVSCESVSAGARRVSFVPQYTGLTGEPVSFSVVNELSSTTAAGPYSLQLYTDNPVITLVARQGAVVSQFSYNWLANCGGTTPPVNTAPTVANPIAAQSTTVGQAYALSLAGVFTDAQTPNQLTLSVSGLPAGLSLSGTTISGTPSVSGVSTITVTATDPGNLSTSTNFVLTVSPAGTTPPAQPFALTGVTTVSCESVSAGARRVSFVPQYTGLTGEPVSFSVVNELSSTTAAGPYSLQLYTDNPVITLVARQGAVVSQFSYNWLGVCGSGNARVTAESVERLSVLVLGNPTPAEAVDIEIRGVAGQAVQVQLINGQGQPVSQQTIEQAGAVERPTIRLGKTAGIYLLQVSTATQKQTVKIVKQ